MGRVLYFVKAVPAGSEAVKASLRALGLPLKPQRFAIVEAYTADSVQQACDGINHKTPWAKAVAEAMVAARVLSDTQSFFNLLMQVQDNATVLRIGHKSRVAIRTSRASAGALHRLAIPLSSNYEAWYHKNNPCANWAVEPVVRIDPRRASIKIKDTNPEMMKAITAARNTLLYFVQTFSNSNSRM